MGCKPNLSSFRLILVAMVCVCMTLTTEAMPPQICDNKFADLSPYARRLCSTLSNIAEFSKAIEDYLDSKVLRSSMNMAETAEVKRQDLDHVFLRFGRSQK